MDTVTKTCQARPYVSSRRRVIVFNDIIPICDELDRYYKVFEDKIRRDQEGFV